MPKTYNSAITGRYVTKAYADSHKSTTESHKIKPSKPTKSGKGK